MDSKHGKSSIAKLLAEIIYADLDFIPGTDPRYAFYATDLNHSGIHNVQLLYGLNR